MSGFHFPPIIFNVTSISQVTKSGLVADEARQKLYSACEAKGVAITVMKPLGAGTLLKAESSPFGVAMTVPQCIQYCLDRNGVKVVIVGCHTVEEVLEAVKYYDVTDEERSYAHIFSQRHAIRMTGRCMYCNHCQPCPYRYCSRHQISGSGNTAGHGAGNGGAALSGASGYGGRYFANAADPNKSRSDPPSSGQICLRRCSAPGTHAPLLNPVTIVSKSPQSLFRTGSAGFCF